MATSLAVVLSGCAATAPIVAKAPVLPANYERASAPTVSRNISTWWRQFHDPLLERLVEQTRRQNLSVSQAQARLRAGRAQAGSVPSQFLPTVDGSGQAMAANTRKVSDDSLHRPIMAGMDMNWEIGMFGLSEHSGRAARADESIAQEDFEAVRIAVTAEVAAAYVSLRSAQRQQEVASARVSALQRRIQLSQARARNGLAAPGDETDGIATLEEARSDLAKLESRAAGHRQQIATLLGVTTVDNALLQSGRQPHARDIPTIGYPADLLRARPDVRAAEQRLLKASAEVGIAQADLYPKLRLAGTVGIGGPSNGSLLRLAGGPSLQIPLFDYGRREATLYARRALLDEALASYRQTVLVAYQEASTTFANWRANREAGDRQLRAINVLRRRDQQMRVLRREGLADARQFADADISQLDGQQRLALARENEALALIALYKALGAAEYASREKGTRN